jgi:uncharacterized RDD family membrane protein YckC
LIGVGFALLPVVAPATSSPSAAGSAPLLYVMTPGSRLLTAVAAFATTAAYCGWLWSRGRGTLAMRTWRLALVTASGGTVPLSQALTRYVACWIGLVLAVTTVVALQPSGDGRWAVLLLATNYAWALIDREGRFLQDRLAGTRLVRKSD